MSWNLDGLVLRDLLVRRRLPVHRVACRSAPTNDRCKVVARLQRQERRGRGHRRERADRRRGRRHAEGDERRATGASASSSTRRPPTSRRRSSAASSRARSAGRWRRSGRSSARTSAWSARRSRCARTASRTRSGSATPSTSRSRTSSRSASRRGEPAKITGIFHPAGSELTVSRATRSKHQRVRHPVRGQGRASRPRSSPGPPERRHRRRRSR